MTLHLYTPHMPAECLACLSLATHQEDAAGMRLVVDEVSATSLLVRLRKPWRRPSYLELRAKLVPDNAVADADAGMGQGAGTGRGCTKAVMAAGAGTRLVGRVELRGFAYGIIILWFGFMGFCVVMAGQQGHPGPWLFLGWAVFMLTRYCRSEARELKEMLLRTLDARDLQGTARR